MKQKALRIMALIAIFLIVIFFFYLYTREVKILINENTKISIIYNNQNIVLSHNNEIALRQLLSTTTIYRPIFLPEYAYNSASTFFIRIQGRGDKSAVNGVLTICIDNPQNSIFDGITPAGKLKISKHSTNNIISFLTQITKRQGDG